MSEKLTDAELIAAVMEHEAKMTPGEWKYRSRPNDDWGTVAAGDRLLGVFSNGYRQASDQELNEHRREGTDPDEADAAGIAFLRNHARDLYERLTAANARLSEALEKLKSAGIA